MREYNGGFAEYVGTISLPEKVASIGENAFYGCPMISWYHIPRSVKFIADNAFDKRYTGCWVVFAGSYTAEFAQNNNIKHVIPDYIF